MTSIQTTARNLGGALAVIGSLMFVLAIGVGDTWDIMIGNTAHADLGTDATAFFSSGVDMMDRIFVSLTGLTVAAGLGLIGISRNNPSIVNDVLRWAPLLGLAIGVTEFGSTVMDTINGDFDFSTASDAAAAQALAVTGWVIAGLANLLTGRRV